MRVLRATVLNACTDPRPVRYTGKSCCWALATPTGTGGIGALALAFFWSRLQPARTLLTNRVKPSPRTIRPFKISSSLALRGLRGGLTPAPGARHESCQLEYYDPHLNYSEWTGS